MTANLRRRAADLLPTTKVNQCKQLADLACQLDVLKNYFGDETKDALAQTVVHLHGIAMREAGPLVRRIYADEDEDTTDPEPSQERFVTLEQRDIGY